MLDWELRNLFAGTWSCVGRDADLRDGGVRQRAVTVGGVPGSILVSKRVPIVDVAH